MSLPLPRVVADVGPGGPLVTAMGGANSLANDMLLRKINSVKAQYAPLTAQAEAASKLAYANLMGPQFLAKLMGNDSALANMSEDQKKNALAMLYRAGSGQGTGGGLMGGNENPGLPSGVGQPSTNSISGWIADKFKNAFGQGGGNSLNNPAPQSQQYYPPERTAQTAPARNDGIDHEVDAALMAWMNSPEAKRASEQPDGGRIPEKEALLDWYHNQQANPIPQAPKTYAENTGEYKGTVKEGEVLGKHRGDVINDIGEQQMQLSNTGANLDRIIDDINEPKFMNLRKEFPFYQDMQLTALSKIGSPEQQEMIGNFIADVKSFAGATVNSFKGQSMKREFDYADQLKPNENDTVNTARGKLTALKSLKEIASRKNDIILDLMQKQHMNLGDAVKRANNMVDVRAIDKEVKKLTSPMITLKDPKRPGITIRLPLWEARQRGVKNV